LPQFGQVNVTNDPLSTLSGVHADVPAHTRLYKVSILCNGWGLAQPKIGQKALIGMNFRAFRTLSFQVGGAARGMPSSSLGAANEWTARTPCH
jgi:hypothetical protein